MTTPSDLEKLAQLLEEKRNAVAKAQREADEAQARAAEAASALRDLEGQRGQLSADLLKACEDFRNGR